MTSGLLLAIETAGSACSAAVTRGDETLAAERRQLRHGHAEVLLPMIDRVMARAGQLPSQLEFVVAATGPGGFTGIRVGLAAAHGIALAARARLIGITSFAVVAASVGGPARERHGAVLVVLDSRREDLYVQLFAPDGVRPLAAPRSVLGDNLIEHISAYFRPTANAPLLIAGDAASGAAAALEGRVNILTAPDSAPDALGVAAAALRRLGAGGALDPARPLYLRPPDVTLPKPRATAAPVRP
jgi:tRNA threonylcarbamoyladenosine biosynthesis protein TsaB